MRPLSAHSGPSIQNPKPKIQNRRACPAAGLAFAVAALALAGCSRDPGPWKTDENFIMSHRSGRAFAAVETAPAFRASALAGADGLDVDLRLTRDGVVVCSHDGLVITRECFGPVAELDWADLARGNVGFEFDPATPARTVTFDEFVRFCAANRLPFHLEAKSPDNALAAQTLAIIDRHQAMPLCSGISGFKAPKRDDYKPVNLGVHTPGTGGDDDVRFLRRAAFRHEGAKLRINIDDCRMLADLLDRHGERRPLDRFRFDVPPKTRLAGTSAPDLAKLARCDDNITALAAVNEIVRREQNSALPTLRALASDARSPTVRAASLWALGRMKDAQAYGLVTQAAMTTSKGRDAIVTFAATWALSEYNRPEGVATLRDVLMRGVAAGDARKSGLSGWHAEYAARALGRMSAAGAVESLGAALEAKPSNEYLTQEIAAALARQGLPAVPHLVACLGEDRRVHRREIVWALVRLEPYAVDAVARQLASAKDLAVRRNCLRVLGLCERPSIDADALLGCLGSDDPDTRLLAAWVAGKHRVRAAKDRLTQLLSDEDEPVRAQAAQALTRL
jgi:HEAT repeat protein